MILLIDAGNTRFKWAQLRDGKLGGHGESVHRDRDPAAILQPLRACTPRPDLLLVSNVAGPVAGDAFRALARDLGSELRYARVIAEHRGITVGYREPDRLGVDRWLAVMAAFDATGGSVCVADAGTAFTVDAVDSRGRHLGGMIAPGLTGMKAAVFADTSDVLRHGGGEALLPSLFGRSTAEAVAGGALYALAALTDRLVSETQVRTGETPRAILTGGDAEAVGNAMQHPAKIVPDLVLRGLAVLARQEEIPG